jgi:hypothetical protein
MKIWKQIILQIEDIVERGHLGMHIKELELVLK